MSNKDKRKYHYLFDTGHCFEVKSKGQMIHFTNVFKSFEVPYRLKVIK